MRVAANHGNSDASDSPGRAVGRSETGASALEYALYVSLMAVVVVVAIASVGASLSPMFDEIPPAFTGTTVPDCGPFAPWYPDPGFCGE